ncbi:MAG: hypothetical protein Q4D23_01970 [Bacteroidales bacterium]|nr:hypothetical protein [Bacteroidales bacterium]
MKKFILLAFTAALSLGASAQGYQGYPSARLTNGFYRVQNVASNRYAYVNDNTGGINMNNTSADMGAITLSKDMDPYCDPASVCYVKKVAHKHDVIGQNTSLYGFINHYVQFQDAADGESYLITPLLRINGQETDIYLSDGAANSPYGTTYVKGETTKETAKTDKKYWWNMIPMDFAGSEYLGIKPDASMQAGDKYYKPYIVGFDMQLSKGMKAYYVTEVKTDAVIIAEYAGDVVPANMPVIIECSSATASDNRVTLLNGEGSLYTPAADNMLVGQYFCNENHGNAGDAYRPFNSKSNRVLAVVDGMLTYVTGEEALKHTTVLSVEDK